MGSFWQCHSIGRSHWQRDSADPDRVDLRRSGCAAAYSTLVPRGSCISVAGRGERWPPAFAGAFPILLVSLIAADGGWHYLEPTGAL